MKQTNLELREKILKVLSRIPFVSISEDEGTVGGRAEVLHNLHFFDHVDWQYRTFFLSYFETENKEEPLINLLINHWRDTIAMWKLKEESISGFVSDFARSYAPRSMASHMVCAGYTFLIYVRKIIIIRLHCITEVSHRNSESGLSFIIKFMMFLL
jgi:hypothetical protein